MFEKKIDKRLLKNFDFIILLIIFLLVGIGILGIGIAKRLPTEGGENFIEAIRNLNVYHVRLQFLWFLSGLVLMGVVISIDYHIIGDYVDYIYWIVVALLLYVDVAGAIMGGAQSWIPIGPFALQPSEFAKISIILTFAKVLSKKGDEGINHIKDLIPILLRLALPLALILAQPDFGTAAVFIVILFGMLFVSNISYKLLFGIIGSGVTIIPVVWFALLSEVQKDRIRVFLNPELDPMGKGYQVSQSITAIGSGRIIGKGILTNNTLSQLNFLPAAHTDFIFAVLTEAFGFVGGIVIIGLYLFLIIRTIMIAVKAKDKFGSLIVIGVAALMIAHIFENIGMTMGLTPVTGIPLPFMSYGGSFMWTNMIAYGLVLNIGMRRQKIKF